MTDMYKLYIWYQNYACELTGKDIQDRSQVESSYFPLFQSYLTSGLVLSSSPHWWALYFLTSAIYLDQASPLSGSTYGTQAQKCN